MRENVRDRERLEHIIEAIDCILDFSDCKTKEELEADKLKFYGIVKNIEIIGEAAYKLTHAFCREHPETPWEFIMKMRHVLVHETEILSEARRRGYDTERLIWVKQA